MDDEIDWVEKFKRSLEPGGVNSPEARAERRRRMEYLKAIGRWVEAPVRNPLDRGATVVGDADTGGGMKTYKKMDHEVATETEHSDKLNGG